MIDQNKCIGCGICAKNCPVAAISMESKLIDYKEVLPALINKGIDCIEFHAITEDEADVDEKWAQINEMFDGMTAGVNNFDLYKKLAMNFRNLIHDINDKLPEDVIVYFLHHTETDKNTGKISAKTVGCFLMF